MANTGRARVSAGIVNASLILYMVWLLLPAVQTALHAVAGAATVALFGVGVLVDSQTLRRQWASLCLRALLMAALPFALFYLMARGGGNLPAYLAQQGMFWFPMVWCAYARQRGDARVYRFVTPVFLALMALTTLTTIGWLVEGLLRGGKVYAYARSLGSGEPGNGAYLRELMGKNIGGYDFVYATVLLLPITFQLACKARGARRLGFAVFFGLQLALVGLSQYTYAILFAAGLTAVELLALLLRRVFRCLSVGRSLLAALPLIAAVWLFRVPLLTWAGGVAAGMGFQNAQYSLTQLLAMLTGGAVDAGSRLATYTKPLAGFMASPLLGSLAGGTPALGMHSDLLDMLSATGLIGTALFALGAWALGRGAQQGLMHSPAKAQLLLQWCLLFCCLALGTVFYSRELPLAMCMGYLLLTDWQAGDTAAA